METGQNFRSSDGAVMLAFRLPEISGRDAWKNLRAEFVVTVADTLTMELTVTNNSAATMEIENCLHTYFSVGDIGAVSLTGLEDAAFLDNAAGGNGGRKIQDAAALRIAKETNRIYLDTASAVEIRDEKLSTSSAWKNSIPSPPSSGIRGRRRNCRTTSIRRSTNKWSAWNPAT